MIDFPDIFAMPREQLKTFKRSSDFIVEPDSLGDEGRLTIHAAPIPGHQYVAGADFAYGIDGRDYDTLVIADKTTWPVEQVAELEGRWGERFDRLLYCLLRFYFNAFLVGERQVGLPILRALLSDYEYGYLYYNRAEETKGRRRRDALGHFKVAGDVTIPRFRRAIRENHFIPRSERLLEQIKLYQFRPKGKDKEKTEDMRDVDMTMGAPAGEFDDLVNGGAYCWKGVLEVHLFEDAKPQFEDGKAGAVLGMGDALKKQPPKHMLPPQPFKNRATNRGYSSFGGGGFGGFGS